MDKTGAVAMRLFANWETDRASSSTVQRVFTLGINRLELTSFPISVQSIVLTARLEGYKRTLRCNDIVINPENGKVDITLDVSFNIQYPHFLKRGRNILQIMIQRRRKYKNRPIPGGFKTVAIGMINLSQLLQMGNLREITLWNAEDTSKETTAIHSVGRLSFSTCHTSPLDYDCDRDGRSTKKSGQDGDLSEEESESDYDEMGLDSEIIEPSSSHSDSRNRDLKSKLVRRKNLKQKLSNLLKKFKVAEDDVLERSAVASVSNAPTAKEIEAIFEELEEMSDSGPEMGGDDISIGSNPRPALRPYFTHSREVLPAIYDNDGDLASDSDNEELDWSSEENTKDTTYRHNMTFPKNSPLSTPNNTAPSKTQSKVSLTNSVPLTGINTLLTVPHSQTISSIVKNELNSSDSGKTSAVLDKLSSLLSSDLPPSVLWISSSEGYHHEFGSLPMIVCNTAALVKQALSQIIAKIHNFCNSNSANPPTTVVGLIGNDKLVSQVLRAYVDCLHHKSSSNWLQYLCFVIVSPPSSLIGRLIYGVDSEFSYICRDIWERWHELSPKEISTTIEKLEECPAKLGQKIALPIGEALLQLCDTHEMEASATFVPFLAEVRVGQIEDEEATPRGQDDSSFIKNLNQGNYSPPCSPHTRLDAREMNVEYWIGREHSNDSVLSYNSNINSKKDHNKGSLKTAFRSLMISRSLNHHLLSLSFIREKRKGKMLQKLGMNKGQKSDIDTVQVLGVTRLLCSGLGKHSDLSVSVDGNVFHCVKYFQTSAQWQTHVKTFPICFFS
ncbi:unnamed protein product [Auanema sp. JU1783]|nr:unnamed protein product [Auanema sp. JU1783]